MLVQIGDFVRVFDNEDEGWEYVFQHPFEAVGMAFFCEDLC